jgi:hypothetical protein
MLEVAVHVSAMLSHGLSRSFSSARARNSSSCLSTTSCRSAITAKAYARSDGLASDQPRTEEFLDPQAETDSIGSQRGMCKGYPVADEREVGHWTGAMARDGTLPILLLARSRFLACRGRVPLPDA